MPRRARRSGLNFNIPVAALTDPAIRLLSANAFSMWAWAGVHCMSQGTDGEFQERAIPLFAPTDATIAAGINELVTAGVWQLLPDGWIIFADWERWQTTAEEREGARARNAADQKRYRERQAEAEAQTELRDHPF